MPRSVSVNSSDGSCWVADSGHNEVVHVSAGGAELWRSAGAFTPGSLSVNPMDGSCWVADRSQVVHLEIVVPPVASFTGTPTSGTAPLAVTFTDTSTNSPTSWSWSFGDGGTSTAQNPSHTYTSVGSYTVALTASNSGGSDTCTAAGYLQANFPDVASSNWAYSQIMACAEAGIVQGSSDGQYLPTQPVTRDQMAVFMARALCGGEAKVPTGPSVATFPDVPTGFWAFKYIACIGKANITQGYTDGDYHPERTVTRDQMAVFIARSIVTPTGDANVPDPAAGTQSFPDVGTDQWAYKYIEYCHAQGVVQGYTDGTYGPGNLVTRDQMAVFVAGAFKLPN